MNHTPEISKPPFADLVPATPVSVSALPDSAWPVGQTAAEQPGTIAGVEFTPGRVLRALRRRWYAAILLAAAGAAAAGYLADRFVGSTHTARTQVYIPSERAGSPFAGQDARADSTAQQRRQSAFVRSRRVLQLALQKPGVADVPLLQGQSDPIGWLEKELQVDFSASPDLMRITLKGNPPEDLLTVLNAVREAYLQEASNRDVTDKTGTLRWLRQVIAEEQTKHEAARADVSKKAGEMNAPDAATVRLRYQGDSSLVASLRALRFQLDVQANDLQKARDNLVAATPDAGTTQRPTEAEIKAATELALAKDAEVESYKGSIRRLVAEIAEQKRRIKPGSSTPLLEDKEAELKEAKASLATREETVKAEVNQRLEDEARRSSTTRAEEHRARLAELADQIGRMRAQIRSIDVEIQKHDAAAQRDLNGIAELDRLTTRAADVEAKIKAAQARAEIVETELGVVSPNQAQTHEEAVITQVPNPAKKKWVVAGAVGLGFLAGLFGIAFLDLRGGRIDSPEGVDRQLHTGVVGCIPRVPAAALANLTRPGAESGALAEAGLCDAVDACRTLLLNALSGSGSKVIMVTSAVPGEGKTSLASQLALSLGRGGYRTLLIDADVRHPGIHTTFGRSESPGLTDVLRKTYPVHCVVRKSPLPNLNIIPAGQCNPQEAAALFQFRMGSLVRKCKPHYEVIVIDTPPLLGLPDAMLIGRHADGTILSLMNEVSTLPAAQAACARLRAMNIPLLGAVLNAARVRTPVGY
jgi:polysaccharide biosynthesis transport protein